MAELPKVFNNPDEILLLSKKDYAGRTAFELRKRINGYAIAVNGISNGKHSIEIDSFRVINKKKSPTTSNATQMSPGLTPEAGSRITSTPIISTSSQNSNSGNKIFSPPGLDLSKSVKNVAKTQGENGTVTWNKTEKDSVSNAADAFNQKWGIQTDVATPNVDTDVAAFLKDGKIVLNANKIDTYQGAVSKIAHEATHIVENTEAFKEIHKAATEYYKAVFSNIKSNDMKEAIAERYKGLVNLNESESISEMTAAFLEEICGGNDYVGERASRILLEKSPNAFKKIVQFFKDKVNYYKQLVSFDLTKSQKLELQASEKALKNLERGLKAYRNGKAEAPQGIRYSISTDEKGNKFVVVDTDQHLFDGKPKSEYAKIARGVINQRFKGKVLPLSGYDLAKVTYKSAGEYAYPSTKIGSSNYNAKMRASTELDNLLNTSEFLYHTDDTKNHPEATLGWDYYKTRFVIDGHMFEGQINIATSDKGRVFYDITKIKELPNSSMRVTDMAQSTSTLVGEYSNTNITSNERGVNSSIRKNSGSDTQYSYGEGTFTDYLMQFMAKKYGTIPKGENTYREVFVPKQTSDNTKTMRGVRTILESKSTPDSMVDHLKKEIVEEAFAYKVISDKSAQDYADREIQMRGFSGAMDMIISCV